MPKHTIILLDNDRHFVSALDKKLSNAGYFVYAFTDVQEAVSRADNMLFDVFICSYDVIEQCAFDPSVIKKTKPDMNIVMICGISHLGKAIDAVNSGDISHYIPRADSEEKICLVVENIFKSQYRSVGSRQTAYREHWLCSQSSAIDELENRYPGITKGCWQKDDQKKWLR